MQAMASHALPAGATTDDDFEILVGAFSSEQRALAGLSDLAAVLRPSRTAICLALFQATIEFAREVYDEGVSHVLEVIFERSRAEFDV